MNAELEKQALIAGGLGLAAGIGKRVKDKAFKGLRNLAVRRKGEFRRGFEAGSGVPARTRRAANVETIKAVKKFDLSNKVRSGLKMGLIGAGGLAAAVGGGYLLKKHLDKKRQEREAMGY